MEIWKLRIKLWRSLEKRTKTRRQRSSFNVLFWKACGIYSEANRSSMKHRRIQIPYRTLLEIIAELARPCQRLFLTSITLASRNLPVNLLSRLKACSSCVTKWIMIRIWKLSRVIGKIHSLLTHLLASAIESTSNDLAFSKVSEHVSQSTARCSENLHRVSEKWRLDQSFRAFWRGNQPEWATLFRGGC